MTTLRLVPFADLNLRARVDETGRIRGFVDDKGRAVLIAVADDSGQIGTAAGGATAFRSDTLPVNSVPPIVTGDGTVAVELTSDDGTWTAGADNVYTYQWMLGVAPILGATASTYTPLVAQIGFDLTLIVTATDPAGSEAVSSNSVTVIDVSPVNSVAPVISGSAVATSTLTATTGTWSGSTNVYTYQWQKDGVNIAAATANTHVTVVGEINAAITCVVTATNSGGTASQASNAITVTA